MSENPGHNLGHPIDRSPGHQTKNQTKHRTKYQAIEAVLRQRILSGEYEPGSRLPAQEELASRFGVTLMTLRQAIGALEAGGLVWAARGKGTFVADRPVDIRLDNLSSFVAQMSSAGTELTTKVLNVEVALADEWPTAAEMLGVQGSVVRLTRLRSVADLPIGLQRSYLDRSAVSLDELADLDGSSLYELLESRAGWVVSEARETISAVELSAEEAAVLEVDAGRAALDSIRVSINQFGRPYLYDEALLVGGRTSIVADRTSERLSLRYGLAD